jgi:hypothetical protein
MLLLVLGLAWVTFMGCADGDDDVGDEGAGDDDPATYDWRQVNVLFEIHLHNLIVHEDPAVYGDISDCVLRIGEVLAEHNVKASWGVMEGFATAAAQYEIQEDNVLRDLEALGHEIGMHSLAFDQDPTDVLKEQLGFDPVYSCPGFGGSPTHDEALMVIEQVAVAQGYRMLTDHLGWIAYAPHDDLELIHAWQPSLDPGDGDFTAADPDTDLLMVNQQGGGWVGARDVDTIDASHFAQLQVNAPLDYFLENTEEGKLTVYPVTCHEDLFTTGPLIQAAIAEMLASGGTADWSDLCLADDCDLRDEECSEAALDALDVYLTDVIDPLMAEGKVVSRTYGELYQLYFD